MKILALSASPRLHGNSAHLVDQLLASAREAGAQTERLDLNPLHIRGCQADYACKRTGRCGVKDDMQALYDKIDAADAVVFASPIYGYTVSAQLKTVLDRLFSYLNMDMTSRMAPAKRSALIFTQGAPDPQLFADNLAFLPKAFELIGLGRPQMLIGAGLGETDAAARREDLVSQARELGKNLATNLARA